MKIKFTISKSYNHFFFVQTLADWHFSCRSQYIKKWLKETGPLTEEEKNSLIEFKTVLQKYGFDPIKNSQAENAFDFFMRYEEFKNDSPISNNEIDIYLKAIKALEPRFNKIWKTESVNLGKVKKLLSNKFNKNKEKIVTDLKTLFNDQINIETEIEVILLISTEKSGGGGGANNGPNIITLECSSITHGYVNHVLSALWHEITHLILKDFIKKTVLIMEKSDIIKEASQKTKKTDFNYARELLVFSLFCPVSFLTGKYFPTKIGQELSDAVSKGNTKWLLEARHVFIMYLIYLNGQFIRKMLIANQSASPEKMASAIIENHKIVKTFYNKNNKKPIWFNYG